MTIPFLNWQNYLQCDMVWQIITFVILRVKSWGGNISRCNLNSIPVSDPAEKEGSGTSAEHVNPSDGVGKTFSVTYQVPLNRGSRNKYANRKACTMQTLRLKCICQINNVNFCATNFEKEESIGKPCFTYDSSITQIFTNFHEFSQISCSSNKYSSSIIFNDYSN